jgi:hypothetical protein
MRYIVTVAALILSCGIATSYDQGDRAIVFAPGTHSCGRYLAAVHGHAPGAAIVLHHPQHGPYYDNHTRYMDWLAGFLSATNFWVTDEPNGIKSDDAALDVWLRKWCDQNPTKTLMDAASRFVFDQRKDYIKAWFARQER